VHLLGNGKVTDPLLFTVFSHVCAGMGRAGGRHPLRIEEWGYCLSGFISDCLLCERHNGWRALTGSWGRRRGGGEAPPFADSVCVFIAPHTSSQIEMRAEELVSERVPFRSGMTPDLTR
jgi:hypothetical protein